jgi:hypothetical protein
MSILGIGVFEAFATQKTGHIVHIGSHCTISIHKFFGHALPARCHTMTSCTLTTTFSGQTSYLAVRDISIW